ncbi:methyl-accepting chemotaxis protein [Vibrio sp. WXL210]|uniref:methyl-accepting chemotaxis protein n=1 Tax=Vibrio sp. WXL210 TaxID=3450709 RepID=UPI003EC4D606
MSNSQEYILQQNEILISTTDMSGKITFVDDNFVRISGFSREELIGRPHNIVRHPDMPKEVFADLWKEIKLGHCWSGIIKNRQKGGGFYWVKSDVTPLYKDGAQVGFMSVRSMPNKVDVEKIKLHYAKFKQGAQGNHIIRRGKVVNKQKKRLFRALSIKQRLFGLVSVATLALLTVLGIGIHSSYTEKQAVENLYYNHIEAYSRLRVIDNLWTENRFILQSLLLSDEFSQNLEAAQRLKENTLELEQTTQVLVGSLDANNNSNTSKYQIIAQQSDQIATTTLPKIYSDLISNDITKLDSENYQALIQAAQLEIDTYQINLNNLVDENRQQSLMIYQQSNVVFWSEVALSSVMTLLFIAAYLWFAFSFNRDISSRLEEIRHYFTRLVKQDYLFEIDVKKNDEIGLVLQALKSMKVQLAYSMESVRQKAVSATRIKIALDNVSTNMMIEDSDNNIIYVNPAIVDMFKQAEQDIKAIVPSFDADKLVGLNVRDLNLKQLKSSSLIASDSASSDSATNTDSAKKTIEIDINGRTFKIVTNPVIDAKGQQIGYVTEWVDRTSEIAVEREVGLAIQSAVDGDFSKRIDFDGNNAFFSMLCSNINRLLEINQVSLTDIDSVLSALAKGELTSQITADYSGTFGELKNSSNLTVSKLKEMIQHIKVSADTINTAAKEIAIGNVDLAQRTEKQARNLEVTSSSMEQLTTTVKQNSEHSKKANQLAKQTSSNALEGGKVVEQVVENMAEIHSSSREVMNIISVIDSIAFQTNILALNAAVEAARAGEQGRGFAVVATEVRNLAQRSASAAKEVESLINSSVTKIETGTKLASRAGESISGVVSSVQQVAELMEEITQASVEQSVGIDQVTQAILEVDDVTQQNSALVEQGSAAASSLEEQVANLALYVSMFDTGEADMDEPYIEDKYHDEKPQSREKTNQVSTEPLVHCDDDWTEF